jgi:predicted anti-sigma-YlaC factor YlaD
MSNHVIEWLNAYLDGELRGGRLQNVKEHLLHCEACRAELESLQGLSVLLQEVPTPEFTPNERFVSQVNLRLAHRPAGATRNKFLEVGWWMVPVGLLAAWVFISTAALLGDAVSAAKNFGVLDNTTASFISAPSDTADVTSTLGQFGMLQGKGLQWAETTESFSRNLLPQIVLQVSVALLYLTWFAIWWARHTRQGHGQLLEG